ncbi:MAG: hypothetical protein LBF34_02315, partial [Puniceicoccales bacterium]|nr:hypothetical protein [Puniceicoccales bacterium]
LDQTAGSKISPRREATRADFLCAFFVRNIGAICANVAHKKRKRKKKTAQSMRIAHGLGQQF